MSAIVDHTMIRVEDLEESVEWYTTHLDYEEKSRTVHDTFTLVFLGPEDVHEDGALLELTHNHDDRTYTVGDAWGHVAVRVADVHDAYYDLMDGGVEDLEESTEWYRDHFGYEETGRWEADTFTNVFLGPEGVHEDGALLELTYNHDGRSYTMGDGWGHIAVRVADVHDAYYELMDEGVEDYRRPEDNPGYAFVKDPDGHEIEIVER